MITVPPTFKPRRETAAFTLIEILLAVGIFSMVIIAIYSSWTAILRGSKAALDTAADVQRTRIAVRALEEALGSAEISPQNIKFFSFFADTSDQYPYLSFVARLPDSFPGSGLFGDDSLRRVTFSVEAGPGGQSQLVLRQSPMLEATHLVGEPYKIVLAPSVTLFEIQFLHPRQLLWVDEWVYTNALPRMVRLALGFGQRRGRTAEDVTVRVITLNSTVVDRTPAGVGAGGVPPGGVPPGSPGGTNSGRRLVAGRDNRTPPGETFQPPGMPPPWLEGGRPPSRPRSGGHFGAADPSAQPGNLMRRNR